MSLKIRFDTQNNRELIAIENISEKINPLGANFTDFISLDMENILNDEIISNLSNNNYKEIISKITTATAGTIIPEIIYINILIDTSSSTIDMKFIRKSLTEVLKTYNKFKEITEFCYFNKELKDTTPFQKYIYYLHKFKIEEVILPKQTINSFGLKPKKTKDKLLKNDNVLVMLQANSPFFYFMYECLNINDYMTTTFLQLIENNYSILKCKNCSKYFIPYNRADTLYCDRISPQDSSKSCKKYGITLAWSEKIKDETDWHCLYRRVYQSLQMKAKRNPNYPKSKQDFDNFREDSKKWKKEVKEHTKTEEEFINWLQDFRNKK